MRYQGFERLLSLSPPPPKFSRLHEMNPLKSICAKLNLYSLPSPSRVLLGVNTRKIQLSTNTEVARCVSVQLNIINTQALFGMNAFMSDEELISVCRYSIYLLTNHDFQTVSTLMDLLYSDAEKNEREDLRG